MKNGDPDLVEKINNDLVELERQFWHLFQQERQLRFESTSIHADAQCAAAHSAMMAIEKRVEEKKRQLGTVLSEPFKTAAIQEAQRPTPYAGVWKDGKAYPAGCFVTKGGSLWHANSDTVREPGKDRAWTLAVKRGKAGRIS